MEKVGHREGCVERPCLEHGEQHHQGYAFDPRFLPDMFLSLFLGYPDIKKPDDNKKEWHKGYHLDERLCEVRED